MGSPLPSGGVCAGLTNQNEAKATTRIRSTIRVDFFFSSPRMGVPSLVEPTEQLTYETTLQCGRQRVSR